MAMFLSGTILEYSPWWIYTVLMMGLLGFSLNYFLRYAFRLDFSPYSNCARFKFVPVFSGDCSTNEIVNKFLVVQNLKMALTEGIKRFTEGIKRQNKMPNEEGGECIPKCGST